MGRKLTEDERQRKKFERGGRIEAYTLGEILHEKKKKKGKKARSR